MTAGRGSRAARFIGSVVLLVVFVVVVPWVLLAAAQIRFGGASPLSGVPATGDWEWERIRRALTDQLTEDTIADIVIRASLSIVWVAVVIVLVTVVAETAHMLRHGGIPLPDVRGLGAAQSLARVIAGGLIVVAPLLTTPSRAVARDASLLEVDRPIAAAVHAPISGGPATSQLMQGPELRSPPRADLGRSSYVVRSGDSIYAIAERFAGPAVADVAAYAEQLLELNLGRDMVDGRRFVNAAFIDVGWVLDLPVAPDLAAPVTGAAEQTGHVVQVGESLWSIADDELGDPDRWPEIFEANRGRTFPDGRTLSDPSLIHPGWSLELPGAPVDDAPVDEVAVDEVAVEDVSDNRVPDDGATDDPVTDDETSEEGSADRDDERPVISDGVASDSTTADEPTDDESTDDGSSNDRVLESTVADDTVADDGSTGGGERAPRPGNRWIGSPSPVTPAGSDPVTTDTSELELLTVGRAAMLSAGVLTLVAVRRRRRLRQSRPRAPFVAPAPEVVATERLLRAIDPSDRFVRVDLAIRASALAFVDAGERLVAAIVDADGAVEVCASGSVRLESPWSATDDPQRWELPGSVPIELLAPAARRVGAPCPTLVQLGQTDDGRDLFVDLEALEALEIGGPGHHADAIVTALAATLAGSVLAEVTTLIGVGVDDTAFLGHRHHVAATDLRHAFDEAGRAAGATALSGRTTFELRTRATGGETWEPAVILIGAAAGTVTVPSDRTALAVVSASAIHGPSSRLAPDGDAWVLRPLGVRCVPVGLGPDDLAAVAALVDSAEVDGSSAFEDRPAVEVRPAVEGWPSVEGWSPGDIDDDRTLVPVDEPVEVLPGQASDTGDVSVSTGLVAEHDPEPSILVRLIGPVEVRAADGRRADFRKSKALELVAWLATHRLRATRSGARTALWELDVRNETFANVVSEARRSLARLVEPPAGEEWIGRTLTESLPLHSGVRTDADLIRDALATARLQPPEQAIHTLRPAADLVVGVPFEGTGYLWPDAEGISSQFVLLATSVTGELAAHCLSMGDIDGVFDATARGLQVLPGHEELIGIRMRAHARAGDLAGVRHEWELYERTVNADPWSDGEPAPGLVALRRELLTH